KCVVQFGLERLGFERMGLGLYDPEVGDVRATYGTDIEGNLVDERGIRYQPSEIALQLNAANSEDRFVLLENQQLYTADTREEITGWMGLSALWSGTENLGWLSIDNAVHQQDPPTYLLELLALYSSAVGSLLARKQEQIALAESEARFRSLVEGAPIGITISDPEGVITLVNNQAELMFGQPSANLEGQRVELLIDEAHRDQYISYRDAYLHESPAVGTGHIMEVQAVHKDGQNFPVEIQLSFIHTEHGLRVINFIVDITERKEAELTLRDSEEKYRHLVETMSGGLAIADEKARFTYVNDRFCEILGRKRSEIIGHNAGEFVYEEARELYDQQVQNRQEGRRTSYELVVKRKDNTPVHILVSGSALHDREGDFVGSYSIVMDITARKEAELALQNALAKEKELGELKTRFVSMASHEFRTPLATIMAAVETLRAYRHKLSEEKIDQR
ncbi:MAG: PAS domain S-box protein, partial [Anaerolineales bacterium]|nr:PAS domain S-box protein [Anaerolineales bacterium]